MTPLDDPRTQYYQGEYGGAATDDVLIEYLAGDLPAGEMLALGGRLEGDPAFRTMAEPLMRMFDFSVRDAMIGGDSPHVRNEAERDAEWERFFAITDRAQGIGNGGAVQVAGSRTKPRYGWLVMLGALLWAGLQLGLWVDAKYKLLQVRKERFDMGIDEQVTNLRQGRAIVMPDLRNPQVENSFAETRALALHDGSTVALRPMSRLTYSGDPGPMMGATLDGEAVITVPAGKAWMVSTNGGSMLLFPGEYALSSQLFASEALVSIERGKLMAGGAPGPFGAGDFVRIVRDPPSAAATRDPLGYPSLER